MEVGIRKAQNELSSLVRFVQQGKMVYITKRGHRVAKLVRIPKPGGGRGIWAGKINFYPGWDSPEADKEIEEMFLAAINEE